MADTNGKPRSRAGSGKVPTAKSPRGPKKTAPIKTPPPQAVAELSAADIVDSVEQTLAGSVEPAKVESAKAVKKPDVAIEQAAAVEEPVAVAAQPVEVEQAGQVEADPAPAQDVANTLDAEDDAPTGVEDQQEIEQKGTPLMADVMETTRKYTEEAKERFQSAFSEMSEKAKTGVEKSTKAFEELGELAKGNVEALVESGRIASKGIESLGQDAAEFSRMNFEKASAAMKNLAAVKSPAEFFQMQSELLTSAFDSFAKETAKQSEALLKLAGEVAQPISTRVSVVTEKVRSLAA